jgi:hypothetical protein
MALWSASNIGKRVSLLGFLVLVGLVVGLTNAACQTVDFVPPGSMAAEAGKITIEKEKIHVYSNEVVEIDLEALSVNLSGVKAGIFDASPVRALKQGDVLAASVSSFETWSVATSGSTPAGIPILGIVEVQLSDGSILSDTVYPAVMKAKANIPSGTAIHMGGYTIENKRPIKAGDSVPVLVVTAISGQLKALVLGTAVLSVETSSDKGAPLFAAFQTEAVSPKFRSSVLAIWKKAKSR